MLLTCFEFAEKAVAISLDDYLDIIFKIRKILENSALLYANVNNKIEKLFNLIGLDNAKLFIPEINRCISLGNKIFQL